MYKITKVEHLVDKDWLMVVEAPFVARNAVHDREAGGAWGEDSLHHRGL